MKGETPRQAYIRILQSQAKEPSVLEEKDLIYAAELVRGKYLRGSAPDDEDGQPGSVGVTGITLEGRLFLQKLKSDEKDESRSDAASPPRWPYRAINFSFSSSTWGLCAFDVDPIA